MAIKLHEVEVAGTKYAFGNLALRRFNEATGTSPDIRSVYSAFLGATGIGSLLEMVRAGYEQANDEELSEAAAGKLLDKLSDDEQAKILFAFYSSIVGEDFKAYMQRMEEEMTEEEKRQAQDQTPPAPNAPAPPSNGAKSKKKLSGK